MLSIEIPDSSVASASIANTSLTQNPDGWVGSVKVAAGTSTLSLAITDKTAAKPPKRTIHNNLARRLLSSSGIRQRQKSPAVNQLEL